MLYLKFISSCGIERTVSCSGYLLRHRSGDRCHVTTEHRDTRGKYEDNFMLGPDKDYCSLFVMNVNGVTIDKHVTRTSNESDPG